MTNCENSSCVEFLAEVLDIYNKMLSASGDEQVLLACEYNSKAAAYMWGMSSADPCRNDHQTLDTTYSNEIYSKSIENR